MRRRDFITLVGGAAAAWPLAARAQQPAMPVIGYLDSQSPGTFADYLRAFRQGLKDTGYVEGENVATEYRFAENQIDRLPALAADLVRRRVAVIVAGGPPAALAANAATATIPIVFGAGDDPVKIGLVASLARPGGNLTGINFFAAELAAKRLELLREMMPAAARVAVLVDPNFTLTEFQVRDAETAARAMGLQIQVANASTSREINAAFATFVRDRPDALVVGTGPFVTSRRVQLALLAGRYGIPTIYASRLYTEAGGLMSYGASVTDAYRQLGVYAGRILKGAKPADLPVVQSAKFELVINAETARMLGLTVPPTLLATADEVIEWPLVARAQPRGRMRRIGVLMTTAAGDPEGQARIAAFLQSLQPLGWTVGVNVQIDIRFAVEPDRIRQEAAQLAAIAPDVILANSSSGIGAMLQATRSVPIVFAVVADPVGAGFVNSLSRPGGNATGFTNFEYGIGGKWLELLKELRPDLKRAAVIRDPTTAVALGQFGAVQGVAPSLGVEVTPVNLSNVGEIEQAIAAFAHSAHGGLMILGGPLVLAHRDLIIALAARHRLPAVYPSRFFTAAGGLISYGPDFLEQFRRADGYVDRILKGEKPADLPVQAPTKYDLVINLKTAKALGLEIPPQLLARADEVIE